MTAKEAVPLYFAFPDGVYHYVCAECTALCCRGQGFAGSLTREMGQLLSIYPALGSAAISRQGNIVTFATPSGRCHFLDGDNLCRIEKEHGKALKPSLSVADRSVLLIQLGSRLEPEIPVRRRKRAGAGKSGSAVSC